MQTASHSLKSAATASSFRVCVPRRVTAIMVVLGNFSKSLRCRPIVSFQKTRPLELVSVSQTVYCWGGILENNCNYLVGGLYEPCCQNWKKNRHTHTPLKASTGRTPCNVLRPWVMPFPYLSRGFWGVSIFLSRGFLGVSIFLNQPFSASPRLRLGPRAGRQRTPPSSPVAWSTGSRGLGPGFGGLVRCPGSSSSSS